MRVQLKILFLCLLFSSVIYSQEKICIVDAGTLTPVRNVLVFSHSKSTYSNVNGYFSLKYFNSKDSLSFRHILYQQIKLSYNEVVETKIVKLQKKNISTKTINIVADSENGNTAAANETVNLNEHKTSQYGGIGELLKKNTTLIVKDYGGYSSLKTVSSRGMSSENTVVLFNEARVNDLRTGTFNFAEVDSKFINKIVYSKNSDADIQSSGGTVKLFSGNDNSENSFILGERFNSYKTQEYFSSLKISHNKLSYSLNFNRTFSPNKFKYLFDGKRFKRENADFSKSFISGDIQWKEQNIVLKFYTHYSHLLNGLPGFVVTNNFNSGKASSLTNSLLSIFNIDYSIVEGILFSSNIGYHKQYLKLIDNANQLLLDRKSQSSTFDDIGIRNKLQFDLGKIKTVVNYNFDYGQVDSLTAVLQGQLISNFTKRKIHSFSVNFISNYKVYGLSNLRLNAELSYQIINDHFIKQQKNDYFSYRLASEIIPGLWKNSRFIISFTDNYRHPSFNETYYSSLFGGNNLQGEKYKELNVGTDFILNNLSGTNFQLTYFSIWGKDKIIWVPTRLALQVPHNIKKVKSSGFELIIKQKIFKNLINAELIYSHVDARNLSLASSTDNSYNKQLIYTPKNRWNFNAYFNYNNLNLTINTSYVGESYFTADNISQNKLQPYFLLDASVGYKFKLFSTTQFFTVNAYNILNTSYFVIQSYPMPLNSYSINYQMRF